MGSTTVTIGRSSTARFSSPLTVNFTVGGTATFDTDYTVIGFTTFNNSSGSVVIPGNQLSVTMTMTTVPDTIVEPNETVILTIVPTAGVSSGDGVVTWTIENDDVAVVLSSFIYLQQDDSKTYPIPTIYLQQNDNKTYPIPTIYLQPLPPPTV